MSGSALLNSVVRAPAIAKGLTWPVMGERERLLQGAQALATRLPCLGMASDLPGMPLDDLRGAYRFLQRAAGGMRR